MARSISVLILPVSSPSDRAEFRAVLQDRGDEILAAPAEQGDERIDARLQRLRRPLAGAGNDLGQMIAMRREAFAERPAAPLDDLAQRLHAMAERLRERIAALAEHGFERHGRAGEFAPEQFRVLTEPFGHAGEAARERRLQLCLVLIDQAVQAVGVFGERARRVGA